ncbi:MAG TPA: hypothetical protein VEM77_11175 [Thermoplasmata archaeon]|nr:hypothetical protein [Thermoplasmata archaeon]
MAGIGERLWQIGKSPPDHLGLLVFGLVALLTGLISVSMLAVAGGGGAGTAIAMAALALIGIGGFFVTLALFLGAFTAEGDSWTTTVWRIAQLLAAVLVLIFVF